MLIPERKHFDIINEEEETMTKKEAIRTAAKECGISRNDLYEMLLSEAAK